MHLTKTLCTRLSAAALAACTLITPALAAPGTVTAQDGLRLRRGSSTSSDVLATLTSGTTVEVLEAVDDSWYRVTAGDLQGYVSSQYVTLDAAGSQLPAGPDTTPQPDTPSQPEPEPLVGSITTASLNIRSGPGSDYNKVGTLAQGDRVTLLELTDSWYRIEQGYISAKYVEVLPSSQGGSAPADGPDTPAEPEPLVGSITTASLNIRSGPGSDYDKVGTLAQGDRVTLLELTDSWYRIEQGYISAKYVEVLPSSQDGSAPADGTDAPTGTETPAQRTGVVTASTLNVRSGPGSDYKKVSTLSSGAQVTLLEQLDGWYRIEGGYISAQYVTVLDESLSELQSQIVAYARTFLGYPYAYGANGPDAFDCSSLMQYIYKHFGYTINRTATAQLKNGVTVSKENLQLGDLVFFNSKFTGVSAATHVGIYIGDGQFLHASSEKTGVKISDLYSAYYKSVYTTARRIV